MEMQGGPTAPQHCFCDVAGRPATQTRTQAVRGKVNKTKAKDEFMKYMKGLEHIQSH